MPSNAMMDGVVNDGIDTIGMGYPLCKHDTEAKPEIGVAWAQPCVFNNLGDLTSIFPGMVNSVENLVGDLNENPFDFTYLDLTA